VEFRQIVGHQMAPAPARKAPYRLVDIDGHAGNRYWLQFCGAGSNSARLTSLPVMEKSP
jgi:hypothetical protein